MLHRFDRYDFLMVLAVIPLSYLFFDHSKAAVGLVGLLAGVTWFIVMPSEKVVGRAGILSLTVLVLAPTQFVNTQLRYGELMMLIGLAVICIARRGIRGIQPGVPILLTTYVLVLMYSTYRTPAEDAKFQFGLQAIVTFTFLAFGCLMNASEKQSTTKAIIWLGLAEATYAILETAGHRPLLWATAVPGTTRAENQRLPNEIFTTLDRAQGSFGHPLPLSLLLIVALGLLLRTTLYRRRVQVGMAGLLIVGLLLTGSRSALLIALLLALLVARKASASRAIAGIFGLAIVVVIAESIGFFSSATVQTFTNGGSLSHRKGALSALPNLLHQHDTVTVLTGNGWYSISRAFQQGLLQTDGFFAIDNQFVALVVTAGLIGLVVVTAALLVSVIYTSSALRPALVAAIAVLWVFDVNEWPAPWALMVLLVGMSVAHKRPSLRDQRSAGTAAPKVVSVSA